MLTSIDFNSTDSYTTVYNDNVAAIGGTHDLYFVFSDKGITMKSWTFSVDDTVQPETVRGDVNADGSFNVSDLVTMQKWLLAVPDTNLADWKAGDLCKDNRLDVFDLVMMRRELIER